MKKILYVSLGIIFTCSIFLFSGILEKKSESILLSGMVLRPSTKKESSVVVKKNKKVIIPGDILRVSLNSQVDETSILPLMQAIAVANEIKKPLLIRLNSPGGSVLAGNKVIAAIRASQVPIISLNTGLCASMCAMIFEHSHKRYVSDYSVLMFHPASGGMEGNIYEMKAQLDFIHTLEKKLDGYIADRIGMSYEKWEAIVLKNLWIEADSAIDMKLADGYMQGTDGAAFEKPTAPIMKAKESTSSSIKNPNWTM